MIRGTKNEGISSFSKLRHVAQGIPNISGGTVGESIELVDVNGVATERADFMIRLAGESTLPSNEFNGTFEPLP